MRKIILLLCLTISGLHIYCQKSTLLSGVILNSEDNSPVVYATVYAKGNKTGTITNTDGTFIIKHVKHAGSVEIIIRHVGFNNTTIAFDAATMDTIFLTPVSYNLKEANITADKVDEHKAAKELLINITKKYYSQKDIGEAKGYFSLQSSQDDSPYEMLEAYYNADTKGYSVKALTQKCGRAGIIGYGHNILSTNFSNIYINNKLFSSDGNTLFYRHPFSGSFIKNVKHYRLSFLKSFVKEGKEYSIISFRNKRAGLALFDGTITVNRTDMVINEIKMHLTDPKSTHIFPVSPGDKTGNLKLDVLFLFEDEIANGITQLKLTTIDMSYEYYKPNHGITIVDNNSMLFLFDRTEGFLEPLGLPEEMDNDYQAILFTPFSQQFWDFYQRIPRNKEQKRFDSFFGKHGRLINYNGLTQENIFLGTRFFNWTERDKPDIDLIAKPLRTHNLQRGLMIDDNQEQRRSTKVFIDYYIPLFLNRIDDHTEVTAGLVFDAQTSRYLLVKDEFSNLFFHTTLNYLEWERRKLSTELQAMGAEDPEVIKNTYYERLQKIKTGLEELYNATNYGKNKNALIKRSATIEKLM